MAPEYVAETAIVENVGFVFQKKNWKILGIKNIIQFGRVMGDRSKDFSEIRLLNEPECISSFLPTTGARWLEIF